MSISNIFNEEQTAKRTKTFQAFVGGAFIAALVAAYYAPTGPYFFKNFAFYWLPMVAVLLLASVLGARAPAVFGVAIGVCVFFALFFLWIQTVPRGESGLAWVLYYFSMPGAFLGAGASALFTKVRPLAVATTGFFAFLGTSVGLALNVGVIYFAL